MTKTDKYWMHVTKFSNKVHICRAYSFCREGLLAVVIPEMLKDFIRTKKKRLFSCDIYTDKTCVYYYNIITIKPWQDALKEALSKPCKRFSVIMELADGSGIHITAERKL